MPLKKEVDTTTLSNDAKRAMLFLPLKKEVDTTSFISGHLLNCCF